MLGDISTANDVLHELKIKNFPMTEHVYNELIRTYANACLENKIKEEHVDMYIKDAWELVKSMEKYGLEPNIHILNSLLFLYCNAVRAEEMEAKVLPLYDKYRIPHDIYTFQNLAQLYLNIRDLNTVIKLYDKIKEESGISSAESSLSFDNSAK